MQSCNKNAVPSIEFMSLSVILNDYSILHVHVHLHNFVLIYIIKVCSHNDFSSTCVNSMSTIIKRSLYLVYSMILAGGNRAMTLVTDGMWTSSSIMTTVACGDVYLSDIQ